MAVRQQQTVIRKALGNTQGGVGIFPAGVPAHTGGPAACDCGPATTAAAGAPAQRLPPAQAVRGTQHLGGSSSGRKLACSQQPSAGCVNTTRAAAAIITAAATAGNGDGITTSTTNSSRGSSRGSSSQKLQQLVEQKLAARIVEACVDQKFAARATPNMPDGRSFNPGLSLQQSTDYEAVVEAADLERRLERGLVSDADVHVLSVCWAGADGVAMCSVCRSGAVLSVCTRVCSMNSQIQKQQPVGKHLQP